MKTCLNKHPSGKWHETSYLSHDVTLMGQLGYMNVLQPAHCRYNYFHLESFRWESFNQFYFRSFFFNLGCPVLIRKAGLSQWGLMVKSKGAKQAVYFW